MWEFLKHDELALKEVPTWVDGYLDLLNREQLYEEVVALRNVCHQLKIHLLEVYVEFQKSGLFSVESRYHFSNCFEGRPAEFWEKWDASIESEAYVFPCRGISPSHRIDSVPSNRPKDGFESRAKQASWRKNRKERKQRWSIYEGSSRKGREIYRHLLALFCLQNEELGACGDVSAMWPWRSFEACPGMVCEGGWRRGKKVCCDLLPVPLCF